MPVIIVDTVSKSAFLQRANVLDDMEKDLWKGGSARWSVFDPFPPFHFYGITATTSSDYLYRGTKSLNINKLPPTYSSWSKWKNDVFYDVGSVIIYLEAGPNYEKYYWCDVEGTGIDPPSNPTKWHQVPHPVGVQFNPDPDSPPTFLGGLSILYLLRDTPYANTILTEIRFTDDTIAFASLGDAERFFLQWNCSFQGAGSENIGKTIKHLFFFNPEKIFWVPTKTYKIGDVSYYEHNSIPACGNWYQSAICDNKGNNPYNNPTKWTPLNIFADDTPPLPLGIAGIWRDDKTYQVGFNGYVFDMASRLWYVPAILPSLNKVPHSEPTYWVVCIPASITWIDTTEYDAEEVCYDVYNYYICTGVHPNLGHAPHLDIDHTYWTPWFPLVVMSMLTNIWLKDLIDASENVFNFHIFPDFRERWSVRTGEGEIPNVYGAISQETGHKPRDFKFTAWEKTTSLSITTFLYAIRQLNSTHVYYLWIPLRQLYYPVKLAGIDTECRKSPFLTYIDLDMYEFTEVGSI